MDYQGKIESKQNEVTPDTINNSLLTKNRKNNIYRIFGISLVILIFFISVFSLFLHRQSIPQATQKDSKIQTSRNPSNETLTLTPVPPLDTSIVGKIIWNNQPQQILSNPQLSLLATIASASSIQYYSVGTWQSGPYSNNQLIDAIAQVSEDNGSGGHTLNTKIIRASVVGQNLVYFSSSSTYYLESVPANLQADHIVIDFHQIPDLLTSYPTSTYTPQKGSTYIQYPITYQGNTKQFSFYSSNIEDQNFYTTAPPGYHFITTFFHGQKLYARDQLGTTILLSSVENNPYIVIDVDGTQDNIVDLGEISNTENWIKPPVSLESINYLGPDGFIYYSAHYKNVCTLYKVATLSNNGSFNTNALQEVMTGESDTYYFTPNLTMLYQTLYGYFTTSSFVKPIPSSYSYDFFVNTYPAIFKKDVLGEYQIYFRTDYSNNAGGC